ncbi:MAG: right-handed parallel beta-helix repeat-containing protein, partial [Ignavibacteriaceae bacterium]|nr:right-handed parallel beta-helix repeat-containing protein [Ignavibacteriaceae bacterium]
MKNLVLLILLFLFMGNLNAANYYVDTSKANDNGLGTDTSTAWKTVDGVNKHNFAPGDIISFKCGQRFIGITLRPPNSGSSIAPIIFNSYGTGAKPIIDRQGTSESDYCVDLITISRNNITFYNLHLKGGYKSNATLWACNYITFENCDIDSTIFVYTGTAGKGMIYSGMGSHLTIRNCNLTHSVSGHGIYVDGTDHSLIEYCNFTYNYQEGINLAFGDSAAQNWTNDLIVRYNYIGKNGL